MEIIIYIAIYLVGIATGIYASSQLEKRIDRNIVNETVQEELEGRKEMDIQDQKKETYPKFVKKYYKNK